MKTHNELSAMTKEELVRHGNLNFGLGVNKNFAKADLISQIEAAQSKFKGNEDVQVVAKDDESAVPKGCVKIRVRPSKHDKTPRPAIIGHNFKMVSVPVNQDVIMPAKYLPCFSDAKQQTYFQDPETNELVSTVEHTYSYSILEWGPETDQYRG